MERVTRFRLRKSRHFCFRRQTLLTAGYAWTPSDFYPAMKVLTRDRWFPSHGGRKNRQKFGRSFDATQSVDRTWLEMAKVARSKDLLSVRAGYFDFTLENQDRFRVLNDMEFDHNVLIHPHQNYVLLSGCLESQQPFFL